MKKYIYLFFLTFSFLFVACSPEAEDIFGENAATRIEEWQRTRLYWLELRTAG